MLREKIENLVYYGIVRLSLSQWGSGSLIPGRNAPKQGTLEHVSWSSGVRIVNAWLATDWLIYHRRFIFSNSVLRLFNTFEHTSTALNCLLEHHKRFS